MRTAALLTAAAAVIVVAACGDDDTSTPGTPAAPPTVRVETHPELGDHLVDGAGLTLYVFALDDGTTTACIDECVDAWPPLVDHEPVAGEGVDQAQLDVADGVEPGHVMFEGQLLYYYVADQEPGSIVGIQIPEWFAVRPDGSAIRPPAATGPGGY